jgi:succinylglutamate desuccinylase
VGDDQRSLAIAKEIHAPVILGMLEGLKGTTLHYFTGDNLGVKTSAITFESGQHEDPLSVNKAIAAIINCMRTIKAVEPTDVESQHDNILKKYSEHLPQVARLLYTHDIKPQVDFKMKEGYQNFQKISKGEVLANDVSGEIRSKEEGLILMPLYQQKGEDGFFIIREITDEN